MTNTMIDWLAATKAVDRAERVLLVAHVNPDGDAYGSLLGLGNALRERGRKVDLVVDGGMSEMYRFLPGAAKVKRKLKSGKWDVMISVDASDEERTGDAGVYGRAHSQLVINLDHHPTNTRFGDIHLVQPEAVSATEVVYDWLMAMNQPLTKMVAIPLLTGLVTDTLGFRTSNVKQRTLEIATDLMAAGASLIEITARTLDNKSYHIIDLWKHALASVELKNQVIAATVSQQDLRAVGLHEVTDGGLVSLLVSVNEAMIAVVFKELEDGRVELSFRSKTGYDVAQVAFALGGGGHVQAAGATIDGPLDTAKERVMPMLQAAAREGSLIIL